MEVNVKYNNFNDVINEVGIKVSDTQRKDITFTQILVGSVMKDAIKIDVIDTDVSGTETITSTQTLLKAEIIDFIEILQKLQTQIEA